jgi:hypothetical protein
VVGDVVLDEKKYLGLSGRQWRSHVTSPLAVSNATCYRESRKPWRDRGKRRTRAALPRAAMPGYEFGFDDMPAQASEFP